MSVSKICRVLLIEDEPGDANLVRQYLKASRDIRFDLLTRETLGDGLEAAA